MGSVPLSLADIFAPIEVKGSTILCIGLVERDSSPIKTDENRCADKSPAHNLTDVPEFPKSST